MCPPRMVHLVGASDVLMDNVSFTTSGFWMMHLEFCDGVTLDGVTLWNPNTHNRSQPPYEARAPHHPCMLLLVRLLTVRP